MIAQPDCGTAAGQDDPAEREDHRRDHADEQERRLERDLAADDPAERRAADRPEAVGGEREADRLPLAPRSGEVGDEGEGGDPAQRRADALDGAAEQQRRQRAGDGDQDRAEAGQDEAAEQQRPPADPVGEPADRQRDDQDRKRVGGEGQAEGLVTGPGPALDLGQQRSDHAEQRGLQGDRGDRHRQDRSAGPLRVGCGRGHPPTVLPLALVAEVRRVGGGVAVVAAGRCAAGDGDADVLVAAVEDVGPVLGAVHPGVDDAPGDPERPLP